MAWENYFFNDAFVEDELSAPFIFKEREYHAQ